MAQEMLKNYLSKNEMSSPSSFREQQTKEKTCLETTLPDGQSIPFYRRNIEEYLF